eukprot:m.217611 g.217611  ORF g.217611 m.217611 type:complete len:241 (+) comp15888_c0_seq9:290-1012(+)
MTEYTDDSDFPWACKPRQDEEATEIRVYKEGHKIDTINLLERAIHVFGRLDTCTHHLEHPSISRRHAAIVCDEEGTFYIVDMDSAHGTFVDGTRLRPRKRSKIKHKDRITFGGSTRNFKVFFAKDEKEEKEQIAKETPEEWAARRLAMKEKKEAEAAQKKAANGKEEAKDGAEEGEEGEAGDKQKTNKEKKKEARKKANKRYWQGLKEEQKANKKRKQLYPVKKKTDAQRMSDLCGQPSW